MKQNQQTVAEHYVPKMYLKRFINAKTKKLSVYNKNTNKFFTSLPQNICFENDLYECKDAEGIYINPNKIENIISMYERQFDPILENIIKKIEKAESYHSLILTTEEKKQLSHFLALQYLRHPIAKEQHIKMQEERNEKSTEIQRQQNYLSEVFVGYHKDQEDLVTSYGKDMFEERTFSFVRINDQNLHFFTSDFPTVADDWDDKEDMRFPTFYPLTPKVGVFIIKRDGEMRKEANRVRELSKNDAKHVNGLNKNTIIFSHNLIISDKFTSIDRDLIKSMMLTLNGSKKA